LATQGLGWATDVKDSGELIAANFIISSNASSPVVLDVGVMLGNLPEAY